MYSVNGSLGTQGADNTNLARINAPEAVDINALRNSIDDIDNQGGAIRVRTLIDLLQLLANLTTLLRSLMISDTTDVNLGTALQERLTKLKGDVDLGILKKGSGASDADIKSASLELEKVYKQFDTVIDKAKNYTKESTTSMQSIKDLISELEDLLNSAMQTVKELFDKYSRFT